GGAVDHQACAGPEPFDEEVAKGCKARVGGARSLGHCGDEVHDRREGVAPAVGDHGSILVVGYRHVKTWSARVVGSRVHSARAAGTMGSMDAAPPPADPDSTDWTFVLEAGCPECGYELHDPALTGERLRTGVPRWSEVLRRPDVARRPSE